MSTIEKDALLLPPEARVELIRRLWDSLPQTSQAPSLSPEQEAELDRRNRGLDQTGVIGDEWETVRNRLIP